MVVMETMSLLPALCFKSQDGTIALCRGLMNPSIVPWVDDCGDQGKREMAEEEEDLPRRPRKLKTP